MAVAIREEEETVHGGLAVAASEAIQSVRRVESGAKLGHVFAAIAVTIVVASAGGRVEHALGGNADHHTEWGTGVEMAAIAVPRVTQCIVVL
jgi:hypothetical protein